MATTDFFERQERAHRKTALLVFLFALAVALIIVGVYLVVATVLLYVGAEADDLAGRSPTLWQPKLMLAVAVATVAVVAGGSLYKIQQLRGGGRIVAETLGGRPLTSDSDDPQEKRVLNVVEEMAIASGIPAPPVFLLPREKGINAFAAGYSPGNAVIGVTRGAVDQLDRDELQGVIAHEFSHILNGDMRMNIRLMGVINGILLIAIIGYMVLYGSSGGAAVAHRRLGFSAGGNDRGRGQLALIGIGLIAIGAIGMVVGNLMKAAVSRQREFLADASAAQFTRYPAGLAEALKRIAGLEDGTRVDHPHANEVSHMFFGRAIQSGLAGLFSTHPPVETRIRRLDPSWEGAAKQPKVTPAEEPAPAASAATASFAGGTATAAADTAASDTEPTRSATDRVGRPTSDHLQYARDLLEAVPRRLVDAAGEPHGARAVVYALLLDEKDDVRERQLARLAEDAEKDVDELTRKLLEPIRSVDVRARLPLLDVAIGALRELAPGQFDAFDRNVRTLIEADERIDRFEWCLHRMVTHHLAPEFGRAKEPRVRYYALKRLHDPCERLLSTLAHVGHDDPDAAKRAFEQGAEELNEPNLNMRPKEDCGLDALSKALEQLETVSLPCKRRLVAAAATCISADREVTVREAEFFRGICDTLDSPMPPLLPGQPLA